MPLRGQGGRAAGAAGARGYVMVALLVGLSVMAVLLGVALPVWNKQAQREREEEYLFRAHEYARGILKFQRKAGPGTLPPTLDVLVEQRFVRRKYKDPITGGDFQPVYQTAGPIGQPGGGAVGAGATPGTIGSGASPGGGFGSTPTTTTGGTSTSSQAAAMPGAPVIGVVSKSKATSIKIYNGRTRYDQWAVTYQDVKPGRGLPPDLLQAMNQAGAQGQGQPGAGGFGQPGAGQGGQNPFGQPGGAGPPFGQPGTGTGNPFGQPNPQPGANPFGAPGTNPFQSGGTTFTPAYPPPPGQTGASPFGAPPPKKQ